MAGTREAREVEAQGLAEPGAHREAMAYYRECTLFTPLALRSVTTRNRVMLSPMCQYSAHDGMANDWHFAHIGARVVGGVGIAMMEASAVEPRGRITAWDLGIWSDPHGEALARIAAFALAQGALPGIQLAHAGRKASVMRPWEGRRPLELGDGGWAIVAPSPLPYASRHQVPHALEEGEIAEVVRAFAAGARRAREAGFRVIEIHAAHGYLIHEFLSPLTNQRTDRYGGDFAGRARLLLEVVAAVRREWPADLPLFVRISGTDWIADRPSWTVDDSVRLALLLGEGGVDVVDCSSGGLVAEQRMPVHPGYQVPIAERVKREAGVRSAAVGLIAEPEVAEEIVSNGRADLVVLARALLDDPHWTLHAARKLRAKVSWPLQYERASGVVDPRHAPRD